MVLHLGSLTGSATIHAPTCHRIISGRCLPFISYEWCQLWVSEKEEKKSKIDTYGGFVAGDSGRLLIGLTYKIRIVKKAALVMAFQ